MLAISRRIPLVLALVLASHTRASTYVVDAAGGGDFLDLPPAIAAAAAGDVLIVKPGNYSAFVLGKGLTIVGGNGVFVAGSSVITGIPAWERAAVVGLNFDVYAGFELSNCDGAVVLQEIDDLTHLSVEQSVDVRLLSVRGKSHFLFAVDGLTARASRAEVVSSVFLGGWEDSVVGGTGASISQQSRVHVVGSAIEGSLGGLSYVWQGHAPNGGPGATVEQGSEIIATGMKWPDQGIVGGDGGINLQYDHCKWDGVGGLGIDGDGLVMHSHARIQGGLTDWSYECLGGLPEPAFGPTVNVVPLSPVGPELEVTGTPTAGATLQVEVRGEPHAPAVLWLGRRLLVAPTAGVLIEQLVSHDRMLTLGRLDATGTLQTTMVVPAWATPGVLLGVQAELVASGVPQRTNSVPIVVR